MRSETRAESRRFIVPDAASFSARGLLIRAGWLAAVFLLCHIFGLREYTGVLSGTYPTAGILAVPLAVLGFFYAVLYLAFAVAVPILLVAAGVMGLLQLRSSPSAATSRSRC